MTSFDAKLDATGLNCPLPILKARRALAGLTRGRILYVIATDPGSIADFQAFAGHTGNTLERYWTADKKFHFLLRAR